MKNKLYFFSFFLLVFSIQASAQKHMLIKTWATDTTLKVPESVLFDADHKVLYVSNIDGKPDAKDGKGSIGKVGLDGKIIATEWVTGLNAPKGLAKTRDWLWVADVDQVVVIDINTGKIIKNIPIPGSQFLNDICAGDDGAVYVSDSKTKIVHKIVQGKSEVYLTNLKGPNGLTVYKKELYVLDSGGLFKVSGADKKLVKIADGMDASTDGLEHVQGGDFLVSCWIGSIFYVHADGSKEHLLDTHEQKINSADIGFDPKTKMVYVPTFYKNGIVAYKLQ